MRLKTLVSSSLELSCALEERRLLEVRGNLRMIQAWGWDVFWERADEEGSLIPANVFTAILDG